MTHDAIVIVNAGSGSGNDQALVARLAGHFDAVGLRAAIKLAHGGAEIATAVGNAIAERPRLIVAGGGDGTVSTVAAALVDTGIVFGVLPLGTLNHFAKDLGIPIELAGAVALLAHGQPAPVDVGEVNGRVFVNNSSLGLYPDIVHDRERQQKRLGRGKWPAFAWATLAVLRRFPFLGVALVVDGKQVVRRTPFVFIGNNEYQMEGFAIGERSGIEDGVLSLYVAQRPGRWRLFQLALRALTGQLRQARDFDAVLATDIVVQSRKKRLRVATDGEVTVMTPPLHYRVRPASLIVMRPRTDYAPLRITTMRTLVHLSDLHFGRVDAELIEPLLASVAGAKPDVVVVSGDLTQRARKREFEAARAFLDRLPRPRIVVPGNHDVPLYRVWERFLSPLGKYRRLIEADLEPSHVDAEIAVVGINTARSLTFKDGRINEEQMAAIKRRFAPLGESVLKVVVTHHPFDLPDQPGDVDLVGRAREAMEVFSRCGVDLLLSGHFHLSEAGSTAGRHEIAGYSALVVQAGTATSTRARGEENSFNVLRVRNDEVVVERMSWREDLQAFALKLSERFVRDGARWIECP